MGVYGVLQYFGIDFSFWKANYGRNKVFGLFGNVNYFAEYIIIPLAISIPVFLSMNKKYFKYLLLFGITAMGMSLFLTFTRGSYLGIILSLLFIFSIIFFCEGKDIFKKYHKIIVLLCNCIDYHVCIIPNPLNKKYSAIDRFKTRVSLTRLAQDKS